MAYTHFQPMLVKVQSLDATVCVVNHFISRASLVAQLVKNLPAMRETWV